METQKVDFHSDTESEVDRGEVRGNIVWKGNQYPIFEGENIIGREDDCDVTIEHDSVSLKHAVLDYENGVALMRDLKSKNGTSLESSVGSGNYIKLGPTRRNEQVGSGCKIRFGLVDCKFFAIPVEEPDVSAKSTEKKKDLKYDCETQFINMAAPDSDEEDEDANVIGALNKSTSSNSAYDHSYDRPPTGGNPFSASFNRGSSGSTVLEMETQLDQDLNSAEKAQVHSANTPSSIFSARLVQGIASGIDSPAANSGMSTPSAILLRTAGTAGTAGTGDSTGSSTKNSSRSATPLALPLPQARDDTPATAVGDDDCSTEDGGLDGLDDAHQSHRHHEHVPIEIPIPAFHPVGIADEPLSDGSDEESDMSQDLMRTEDHAEEENAKTARDTSAKILAVAAVPQKAYEPQDDIATDDEGDGVDDNASVEFKLAQDDSRAEDAVSDRAVSRAPSLTASTNAPVSSDSPFHHMASADSRLSAPMDVANEDTNLSRPSVASNGHGLMLSSRSNSIVLEANTEANTEPQDFFTAPDPPTAPSVFANASTASPAFSSSPTISGSERERGAQDFRTSVRSPGAAIRDLLKNSAIPDGVKVFRSQGGLVESDDDSDSPAMSSVANSSVPLDAPPMKFDFEALIKGKGLASTSSAPVASASVEASASAAPRVDTREEEAAGEEAEEPVVVKQSKAKSARGRKRIMDEKSDEEFDEPLPARVVNKSSSSSEPAVVAIPEPVAAPKSAVKRARTNSRAPTPVLAEAALDTVELPAVTEAPSTAKKPSGRGRKTPSPALVVEEAAAMEADEEEVEKAPSATKKVPVKAGRGKAAKMEIVDTETPPTQDAIEVLMNMNVTGQVPAKRGRGKAATSSSEAVAEPSSDETVPQVVEQTAIAPVLEMTPALKSAAKRGRGKAPVQEEPPSEVSTEPQVPIVPAEEPAAPVTKTPAKRGRGKVTISEATPEKHSAPEEHGSEPREEEAPAPAPVSAVKMPKRGKSKAAVVDDPVQEEVVEPEIEQPVASEPPQKKARGRPSAVPVEGKAQLEESVVEPEMHTEETAPPAPASKGAKKGTKRGASAVLENTAESAAATVRADHEVQEVRILFTKVDEAPYLKAIKSFAHASVTNDATVATHCVTLPELKRTPKLMVALNCGVKYVVTEQWIKDCVKAKALVDVVKPLDAAPPAAKKSKKASAAGVEDDRADAELVKQLQVSPYIVQDADKEKLWGFSMATTLAIPRPADAVKLFENMCFFCTKGVCGETAPPADELSTIIQSGGGVWLNTLDEWGAYSGGGKSKSELNALVVVSHASVVKKEVNKKVNDAISKGDPRTSGVYSIELVFQACLKQRVEFEAHQLK